MDVVSHQLARFKLVLDAFSILRQQLMVRLGMRSILIFSNFLCLNNYFTFGVQNLHIPGSRIACQGGQHNDQAGDCDHGSGPVPNRFAAAAPFMDFPNPFHHV
ncbi:hypothetical protein D3C76_981510 [compost metagenome]